MTSIPVELYGSPASEQKPSEIITETIELLDGIAMISKSNNTKIMADLGRIESDLANRIENPTFLQRLQFWSSRTTELKEALKNVRAVKDRLSKCVVGKFISRTDQEYYLRKSAAILAVAKSNAKSAGA